MSALLMGRVFYADLPGHLKLTLLALADHAHDDGSHVYPGQSRLARKTSTAIRTVHDSLRELVARGYLLREGRMGGQGGRGPIRYRLLLDLLPSTDQQPTAERQNLPTGSPPRLGPSRPAVDRTTDRQPTATEPSGTTRKRQPPWTYVPEDFETFWDAYPRRDGRREKKAEAVAQWKKLRPDALLQATLLHSVSVYARAAEKPVDAVRYLLHHRWEDDLPGASRPAPPRRATHLPAQVPDDKPARTAESIARVRAIVGSLSWAK